MLVLSLQYEYEEMRMLYENCIGWGTYLHCSSSMIGVDAVVMLTLAKELPMYIM